MPLLNTVKKAKKETNLTETTSVESQSVPQKEAAIQSLEGIRDAEGLRNEYTQVNEFIRHYTTLRFAIMTVYLAAMGGLVSVAFGFFEIKSGNPEHIKLWGRLGGLLTTSLFFIYEARIQSLINFRLELGKKLEDKLVGYTHLKSRPSWGRFRTHHFTIAFYLLLTIFWVAMTANKLIQILSSP